MGAELDTGRRFALSGPEGKGSRSLLRFDLRAALTGRRPDSDPRSPSRCHTECSLYRDKQGGRGHRCDRVQFIYSRLSCREGSRWTLKSADERGEWPEERGSSGTPRWWDRAGETGFTRIFHISSATSDWRRLLPFGLEWVRWPWMPRRIPTSCLDWRRIRLRTKPRSTVMRLFFGPGFEHLVWVSDWSRSKLPSCVNTTSTHSVQLNWASHRSSHPKRWRKAFWADVLWTQLWTSGHTL